MNISIIAYETKLGNIILVQEILRGRHFADKKEKGDLEP